ncbi:MAG: peptide-methionine (S)-S-oxide reductase, partial [Hyphomonas sp.]
MLFSKKPLTIPDADSALPGRPTPIPTAQTHYVFG